MNLFALSATGETRSITSLPVYILPFLILAVASQIIWHRLQPEPTAFEQHLASPPETQILNLMSFADNIAFAKLTTLWVQSHDNQPGISIPYKQLNYHTLSEWLVAMLSLDPKSQYPLLLASRVYAEVSDVEKQRLMLGVVEQAFYQDPNHRWQWLAQGVFVAKHRMNDEALALKLAEALAEHATAEDIPSWAKQMHIFILEDMGELDTAKVLLGGLLESGQITDPNEEAFLYRRIEALEQTLTEGSK